MKPESYTITRMGPREYVLGKGDGEIVRADTDPKKLARWAFEHGAGIVVHAYDLRHAEEDQL